MLFVGRPYLLYYLSQLRRYANGQNGGWEGRHTFILSPYEPYLRSVSIRKKKEFKLDLIETWTSKKSMVILCLYHAMPTLQKK